MTALSDDPAPVDWERLYKLGCESRVKLAWELDLTRDRLAVECSRADEAVKRLNFVLAAMRGILENQ